jgi:hypothetical protein
VSPLYGREKAVQLRTIFGTIVSLSDCFIISNEEMNMFARTALLAAATSITLVSTPVFAQVFSDYNGNDTVATKEQGNTDATRFGGWNNGPPIIGPLFGLITAPFSIATGGWGAPATMYGPPSCQLYHDFNGRYTSVCGG